MSKPIMLAGITLSVAIAMMFVAGPKAQGPLTATINVSVTDHDGTPLERMVVTISDSERHWLGDAVTDRDGKCTLGPVPPGTNYKVQAKGCFYDTGANPHVTVEEGKTLDLHISVFANSDAYIGTSDGQKWQEQDPPDDLKPGLLCGSIRGGECSEVVGAVIVAYDSEGKELARTKSNYFGNYFIYPPPLGTVIITVEASGFISITDKRITVLPERRTVVNFRLAKR